MKKVTFKIQMTIGLIIIVAGFICSTIFKQGIFSNIAGAIYGLLFVIHPVYPQSIKSPRMKLYMRLAGIAVILIAVLTRYGV